MKTRTWVAAFLLAGSFLSFPTDIAAKQPKKHPHKNIDIHVSARHDSLRTTYFSLGLLATPERLEGVGINLVGTAVEGRSSGLQTSVLLNVTGQNANGVHIGGIANVVGEHMNGLQVGGLMNITGDNANGLQIGGLMNVNNEGSNGVIVGGLMNVTGANSEGLIVSGLANITSQQANGVQLSGLMNVTGDRMQGLQIASLLNVSGHRTRGVQLAGLMNVSVYMHGAQIGLGNLCPTILRGFQAGGFNYTKELDGAQLGLVNDCDSTGRGWQLGVVNYSRSHGIRQIGLVNLYPDTRLQWMVYGGNIGKINTALRVLNRHTYTLIGVGTHYAGLDNKFSAGFSYRFGLHQPLSSRLRLSEDLGYVHIENFHAKSDCLPARTYALQGHVNLEYAVGRKAAFFVSGGYNLSRHYGKAGNAGHKPIAEWGIILF